MHRRQPEIFLLERRLLLSAATTTLAPDSTFAGGQNASVGFYVNAVAVQGDGKILLAGYDQGATAGTSQAVLERLNADGSVDTTFGSDGSIVFSGSGDEAYYGVAEQSNGAIVVCGSSAGQLLVARYTAAGAPDPTFGSGGSATVLLAGGASALSVAIDPTDGNIDAVGVAGGEFAVVRLTPAGLPDPAFNYGMPQQFGDQSGSDLLGSVAVGPDGSIVAAGVSGSTVEAFRLNPDGSFDDSFGQEGGAIVTGLTSANPDDNSESVALDSAGNVLVGDASSAGEIAVARLTPAGALDPTFGPGGVAASGSTLPAIAGFVAAQSGAGDIFAVGPTIDSTGAVQTVVAGWDSTGAPIASLGAGGAALFPTGLMSPASSGAALRSFGALEPNGSLLVGTSEQQADASDSTLRRLVVDVQSSGTSGASGKGASPTSTPGTLSASVAMFAPASAIGGEPVRSNAVVTLNNASKQAVAGPVAVALYVSSTPTLAGATQFAQLSRRLTLKPGHRVVVRLKPRSFPSVPKATYYVVAAITAPGGAVTVAPGPTIQLGPRLVAAAASNLRAVPPTVAARGRGAVELTLTNTGNVPASGSPRLTLLVSADGGAPQTIATVALKVSLAPGAARTYRAKYSLPPSLAAGSYTLSASLDVSALGDASATDGLAAAAAPLVVR